VERDHTVERYRDDAHCLVWCHNVQIILSREPPSLEFMRRIVHELHNLARTTSRDTGALLVIRSDCRPPSEEAREYIREGLARARMVAAAQVVTGTGFQGAAMRAALSMIQLITRPKYPMKVFADLTTASTWLALEVRNRAGVAPSADSLAQVAADAYANFLTPSSATVVRASTGPAAR
jgi:hypothetical protein